MRLDSEVLPRFSFRSLYAAYPPEFWALWLGTLINRLGEFVVPLLGFYLSAQRHLGVTQVTLVLSLLGVGRFFAEPLGGALSDASGARRTMILSLGGGGLTLLALGFAPTYAWIVAGVTGYSLLTSLYKPASSAAVAELTTGPQRTRAYTMLYWAINVGASLAPLLGGYLAGVSFRLLFVLDAATMGLSAALLSALFKPDRQPNAERRRGTSVPFGFVPKDPLLWIYMLAALLFATTYQSYKLLALVFVQQGYTAAQYGQALALNGALVVVLGLPLGHVIARDNHPRSQALGALLLGAGFGLHAFAPTLWWHMLAVVIWSLGEIVGYSIGKTVIAELGRPDVRGRYIGLAGSMSGLGAFSGPLLGGWLLSRWGNAPLWLGYAALAGVAALIYWRLEGAVLERRALRAEEERVDGAGEGVRRSA